ncbi:hypothetical protein L218DRAFT_950505 [Marasmius fiardii PR-910]|nr:hypothetical protein L218DRAFT_950505 [Marasmius fiardii PR-910]
MTGGELWPIIGAGNNIKRSHQGMRRRRPREHFKELLGMKAISSVQAAEATPPHFVVPEHGGSEDGKASRKEDLVRKRKKYSSQGYMEPLVERPILIRAKETEQLILCQLPFTQAASARACASRQYNFNRFNPGWACYELLHYIILNVHQPATPGYEPQTRPNVLFLSAGENGAKENF